MTGEVVRTFHTVEGKTRREAERTRDALILELKRKGGAVGYLVGALLKDAGKKSFAIAKLEDSPIAGSIVATLGE